jgi:hypothetical protein
VKKEGMVPNTTPKVPSQEDIRKRKIGTKTGNQETKRIIILTVTTEKKRILIGTERPVIEIPTGRGMNKKKKKGEEETREKEMTKNGKGRDIPQENKKEIDNEMIMTDTVRKEKRKRKAKKRKSI